MSTFYRFELVAFCGSENQHLKSGSSLLQRYNASSSYYFLRKDENFAWSANYLNPLLIYHDEDYYNDI